MISIQQIQLPITHSDDELQENIAKLLGLSFDQVENFKITKRAIDSRKKRQMIYFVYSVTVSPFASTVAKAMVDEKATEDKKAMEDKEKKLLKSGVVIKNTKHHRIEIVEPYTYEMPKADAKKFTQRPVVVGTGPAGMFSALLLAKAGAKPLVIERGGDVDSRIKDVENFMETGELNEKSNIQFGEGGAGTFSDGKLNTLITNPRIKYVFDEFVKAGAPDSILWDAKPHIGTDKIRNVAKNIRKQIIELGGEVRFDTQMTDINIKKGKIVSVVLDEDEVVETDTLVLALGYSARDTYEMLYERKISIEQKPFSIGLRIEHKAEMINKSQYDKFYNDEKLGAAKYKLVSHSDDNRSVYTFCMCPGGHVMPSTSEAGSVITNGMSEYAQDGENSNSALMVNVNERDFGSDHPLAGIEFQRKWEKIAYKLGGSNFHAPVQLVGDFLADNKSSSHPPATPEQTQGLRWRAGRSIKPTYKPGVKYTALYTCLPEYVIKSLKEALPKLDNKIRGFAHPDAVLTGIETRSSSPLRITRDKETMQSNIEGIYPAGEGAGYAGGIVSSAVDGMRVAEAILGEIKN